MGSTARVFRQRRLGRGSRAARVQPLSRRAAGGTYTGSTARARPPPAPAGEGGRIAWAAQRVLVPLQSRRAADGTRLMAGRHRHFTGAALRRHIGSAELAISAGTSAWVHADPPASGLRAVEGRPEWARVKYRQVITHVASIQGLGGSSMIVCLPPAQPEGGGGYIRPPRAVTSEHECWGK